MHQSLAHHARANACFLESIDSSMLEDAGAYAFFNVLAAPRLQHNGFDPLQMQKVREKEPGRPCSDNANLRPHILRVSPFAAIFSVQCGAPFNLHHVFCSEKTSIAVWNAEFAAGTPQ
jgi:hypothetical protein